MNALADFDEAAWQRQSVRLYLHGLSALRICGEHGRWLDEARRRVTAILGAERADALVAEAMAEAAHEADDPLLWACEWFAQLADDAMGDAAQ